MKCFCLRIVVCGFEPIGCVLLFMAKNKNLFSGIKWLVNMEGNILYSPKLKFQCLDVCCKGFTNLFRGARSNPISTFTEDIKFITLTSNEGDGMISHDLRNLVSDSMEGYCDREITILKF